MTRLSLTIVLALLTVGSVTVISGSLSAQTIFTADVEGKLTRPNSPCPDGAFRCGEALIERVGPSAWRFVLVSFEPISDSCGEYAAISTFTLTDGSTLTLSESGTVCGPGNSFFQTPPLSWGNPDRATGSWGVLDGTGQFSELTGGEGVNMSWSAGASLQGMYSGTFND